MTRPKGDDSGRMIKGIGVDAVQIDRFRRAMGRWGKRFLNRLFSENEMEECQKWKDPVPHLAVKFAAKEAFSKAMGTGFGAMLSPRELEVLHDASGVPRFTVSEKIKRQLKVRKIENIFLSLSHDGGLGIAFVIMEG